MRLWYDKTARIFHWSADKPDFGRCFDFEEHPMIRSDQLPDKVAEDEADRWIDHSMVIDGVRWGPRRKFRQQVTWLEPKEY